MGRKLDYNVESAKSALRATVANALAEALILGIDNVNESTTPMTEKQQVAMATMHIMAYHRALETCEGIDFEARLLGVIQD